MKRVYFILALLALASGLAGCSEKTDVQVESVKEVEVVNANGYLGGESTFTVSGKVEPDNELFITPEISGVVKDVFVNEGQEVTKGMLLMTLDSQAYDEQLRINQEDARAAELQYADARASKQSAIDRLNSQITAAEAQLSMMKTGARTEEIELTKTLLSNAKKTLQNARTVYEQTQEKSTSDIEQIDTTTLTALRSAWDTAETAMKSDLLEFVDIASTLHDCAFLIRTSYNIEYAQECPEAFKALKRIENTVNPIKSIRDGEHEALLTDVENNLTTIRTFMDLMVEAGKGMVAYKIEERTLTDAEQKTVVAKVVGARSKINSAIATVTQQKNAIENIRLSSTLSVTNAKNALSQAEGLVAQYEKELSIKTSGARPEEIVMQESTIASLKSQLADAMRNEKVGAQGALAERARSSLAVSRINRAKTEIRAPFSGKIYETNVEIGEGVTPASKLVRFGNNGALEITAFLPDTKASLFKQGDKAVVTAPHGIIDAHITEIRPYIDASQKGSLVTLAPNEPTKKLIEGFSVKITFTLPEEDILYLPLTAIKFDGDTSYILQVINGKAVRTNVTIGNPQGSGVEIISTLDRTVPVIKDARGVIEGETVTFSKEAETRIPAQKTEVKK